MGNIDQNNNGAAVASLKGLGLKAKFDTLGCKLNFSETATMEELLAEQGVAAAAPDEVPDVLKLEVQSVLNGTVYAKNVVANMTHRPAKLVSLHSSIQGWYAGDVLSTGTPRAFHIQDGDVAECRIVGPNGFAMEPLKNPVVDLKKHPEKA